VSLREYAHDETDAQVLRMMCLLEDALRMDGKHDESDKIHQEFHRRLQDYVQDLSQNNNLAVTSSSWIYSRLLDIVFTTTEA
jgi:hypothetical protein